MKTDTFPPAIYIDTDAQLRELVARLADEPLLALDTESNSLYVYRERVCLIQLSTRDTDYIIDPLAALDIARLGPLLSDARIEKVFHAAEYDLICLKRDFGFKLVNLFDTMIAARICGHKFIGLGNLLGELMDIEVDKRHQRDDWGQRPLSADSLRYAQMDTHYLPALRDHFRKQLAERDRLTEAQETFAEQCHVQPTHHSFNPQGYWRLALPNRLTARQAAVLRELYLLREQIAEERNLPPFKILSDKTLVAMARKPPRSLAALNGMSGVSGGLVRHAGQKLLSAINAGLQGDLPEPPPPEPPADPEVVELYSALREWRRNRAIARGVESDVIISKDVLWTLAERLPNSLDDMRDIRGLGPWRLSAYGAEILEVLHTQNQK
ncbi:MAG: ribonuclease D [Chloroflexi bacterium]|nr:ribonuclease D [Chloroflexota bacterium]